MFQREPLQAAFSQMHAALRDPLNEADVKRLFQAPQEVRADRMSSEHNLQGQLVFGIDNGHMTLKPELAQFVQRALEARGKLTHKELRELRVPERDAEQRAYLERLAGGKTRLCACRGRLQGSRGS